MLLCSKRQQENSGGQSRQDDVLLSVPRKRYTGYLYGDVGNNYGIHIYEYCVLFVDTHILYGCNMMMMMMLVITMLLMTMVMIIMIIMMSMAVVVVVVVSDGGDDNYDYDDVDDGGGGGGGCK